MQHILRAWHEDDGVLSFEWVLLVTLLTIGVIGGLAAARDAMIDEMGDVAEAAQAIDQSFSLSGLNLSLTINGLQFTSTVASSTFQETAADAAFTDCGRATTPSGQSAVSDVNGLEAVSGS